MVESIVMLRSVGDGSDPENSFRPNESDLAPYDVARVEDVSARSAEYLEQMSDPRVVVVRTWMSGPNALAAKSDNKIWMIASRVINEDGEVTQTDWNEVYTAGERATRINQMGNILGFDKNKIEAWWTTDKTRGQVAAKLEQYARKRSAD